MRDPICLGRGGLRERAGDAAEGEIVLVEQVFHGDDVQSLQKDSGVTKRVPDPVT